MALRHHADLHAPSAGAELLSVSVGPHGEALSAWATPGARSPHVVTMHQPQLERVVAVSEVLPTWPTVQPTPDDGLFCIGARASWTPEGVEHNGVVLDADGQVVDARCVGDGISHAQVSETGDLWTGFFDEGIYGSLGWGGPGPPPIGHAGLLRRGRDLEVAWEHDGSRHGWISDCYALNVDGNVAWAHSYDDFPIIRVDGTHVTTWATDVSGAQALVVDGTRAALVGGYGEHAARVVVGRLEAAFLPTTTATLTLPDGRPLPRTATLHARGDQLHVFVDQQWLRTDLDQLEAPPRRRAHPG